MRKKKDFHVSLTLEEHSKFLAFLKQFGAESTKTEQFRSMLNWLDYAGKSAEKLVGSRTKQSSHPSQRTQKPEYIYCQIEGIRIPMDLNQAKCRKCSIQHWDKWSACQKKHESES